MGAGLISMLFGRGEPATMPRRVVLNHCHVAGFQYHQGLAFLAQIRPGDVLDVTPEPENPFDPYAVALCWRGRQIGYVPRSENRHLSRMLRGGLRLMGAVTQVRPEADPWEAVGVEVSLNLE